MEDAAVDALRAVEMGREQLAKNRTSDEGRRRLSICLETLGNMQRDLGDREAARSRMRESLELRKELERDYPHHKGYQRERSHTAKLLESLEEEESEPDESDEAADSLNEEAVEQ